MPTFRIQMRVKFELSFADLANQLRPFGGSGEVGGGGGGGGGGGVEPSKGVEDEMPWKFTLFGS